MQLILFDVDGTLAVSKHTIKPEMVDMLKSLRASGKYHLGIVGGGPYANIEAQILPENMSLFEYVFCENGCVAYHRGKKIHQISLKDVTPEYALQEMIDEILQLIVNEKNLPYKRGSFIHFRNGMMYITPIGGDATLPERQVFIEYDQNHKIRKKMILHLSDKFEHKFNYKFYLGGSVGFGAHPIGWDKTYCIQHFDHVGYNKVYFFGDRMTSPDGNDYTLGTHPRIKGIPVGNPDDTLKKIKSILL